VPRLSILTRPKGLSPLISHFSVSSTSTRNQIFSRRPEHQAYSPVEIAARYHHRLVAIHVFSNGNGRHARLMADLLLTELAGQRFEWARGSLIAANELRARYIAALPAADAGDCQPLLAFLENA
jgi:fido (protein-threonine AMPylation protein)